MQKIRLDLDALAITSFSTTAAAVRGTVAAHEGTAGQSCLQTCVCDDTLCGCSVSCQSEQTNCGHCGVTVRIC